MNQNRIINAFLNPEFYEHSVERVELIETHISWVFLAGQFAYKIKKPVNFGFLNFTSLEQRKFYCQQEIVLNSRFAPQIYLEVLPVTQLENKLSLSGQGEIIDYAIKMQQFEQKCLFDNMLKKHQLELSHIDDLSNVIADFHNKINISAWDVNFGSPAEVIHPIEENFSILSNILDNSQLYALLDNMTGKNERQTLSSLHKKISSMYASLHPQLVARKKQGHIRECHGDLHLGNITLIKNKVMLFDGIEFNDSLRWIDTMSDCAFLIMDLDDHNQILFANHFLNNYLLKTGDYTGLSVLKFYKLYRAMVRAKVAGLRLQQQALELIAYKNTVSDLINYLELAENYLQTDSQNSGTFLAISFGLSGSGKSRVCSQFADQFGAIQLSSDIERKRLFLKVEKDLYSDSTTHKTYTHLMKITEQVLNAGYSVIVDATFLDKIWRQKFRLIAVNHAISFHILSCYAEQKTIKQRLRLRQNKADHISDADIAVMESQLKKMDYIDNDEKKYEILIDTEQPLDYQSIMMQIRNN